MALKGFTFWRTYCDIGEELNEKQQKDLYFAIIRYLMYDEDIEEKLAKPVRIAFKALKPNLKTSRSRSQSGKNGNALRWSGDIANESQTYRKGIANESQVKDKVQDKDKDKGQKRPAACPKCGGPLDWTACSKPSAHGTKREWRCRACGEEVWLDE
jgi:hypothetical protein